MSRFKRREPFGKAGLTVAVCALVLALVGGAYAAGGLTKAQEKQVTKIAKKYAGKPGAAGANGTNGTNGAAGKDGAAGTNGTPGTPGANGKGILAETVSPGVEAECEGLGGTSFKQEGSSTKHFACNGQTGFTETLPKGKTETGAWGFSSHAKGTVIERFSFPIPLKAPVGEANSHFILSNEEEVCNEPGVGSCAENPTTHEGERPSTVCLGNVANPEALEGNLCVYEQFAVGSVSAGPTFGFQYPSGALGSFNVTAAEEGFGALAVGSWAVTSKE
jgi:hypothetical protein